MTPVYWISWGRITAAIVRMRLNTKTGPSGSPAGWHTIVPGATPVTPTRRPSRPTWSTTAGRSRDSSALTATRGTNARRIFTNTLGCGTTECRWSCTGIRIFSFFYLFLLPFAVYAATSPADVNQRELNCNGRTRKRFLSYDMQLVFFK